MQTGTRCQALRLDNAVRYYMYKPLSVSAQLVPLFSGNSIRYWQCYRAVLQKAAKTDCFNTSKRGWPRLNKVYSFSQITIENVFLGSITRAEPPHVSE